MIFFKRLTRKRAQKEAKDLLHLAKKVLAYRRDVLPSDILQKIIDGADGLLALIGNKAATAQDIEAASKKLDVLLKKAGGRIYPVTFWSDNVEMFLVATILALGVRGYFFQPFKIPTNSMYPTYYGMTAKVYHEPSQRPEGIERLVNKVTLGASRYTLETPVAGQVVIPLASKEDDFIGGAVRCRQAIGPTWFGLLSAPMRDYTLYVGNKPVSILVPFDFSLDKVIREYYFPQADSFEAVIKEADRRGQLQLTRSGPMIVTNKQVKAGDTILDFDIFAGDMLFVDRISYNFAMPKVGDPIVFHTRKIEDLEGSKYYIKRLVGLPGDVMSVHPPVLYRNGVPITGSVAFEDNAEQIDGYPGYVYRGDLQQGTSVIVKPDHYYAMGDNSPHSLDSRSWGGLPHPETELVGKALFRFYPFSKRWGVTD